MHRCNGASNKRTGKSRSYSGTSNGQHGSSGSSSGLSCCVIFTLFVPVGFLWLPADSDWPPPVASYYVDIRDEASCVRCFNQHTVHAHAASDFKAKLLITHPVFNPIFILLWYAFYAWDDKICIHIYQPLDVDQTSSSLRFYLTASDTT